jgi:hypothetical protein
MDKNGCGTRDLEFNQQVVRIARPSCVRLAVGGMVVVWQWYWD